VSVCEGSDALFARKSCPNSLSVCGAGLAGETANGWGQRSKYNTNDVKQMRLHHNDAQ
jgi:hypothetical protein